MADRILLREYTDWTKLTGDTSFLDGVDLASEEANWGIHAYNGEYWTSGYVGVGRLYDRRRRPLVTDGREHVLAVNSRYGMNPWTMLEKVMADDEYDDYAAELTRNHKFLYRVFYDRPLIRLEQGEENGGDILFALSFIHSCHALCQKGLRKKLLYREENCNAKIRGKIDVKSNIRLNTCHGRNDRFYCRYIDFSEDNVENRILKAALLRCRRIIDRKFESDAEIVRRVRFCLNALKNVKTVRITGRDFGRVSVGGLYTYYKPLLQQAKCILRQKYHAYKAEDGRTVEQSVYTIPYMINMEAVFEFYARTVLKDILPEDYALDPYTRRVYTEKGVADPADVQRGIHLMPYCVPDIVIRDRRSNRVVAVCDAKYKAHDRSKSADSHQLLAYALLTGAAQCGFIMPGEETGLKTMRASKFLDVAAPSAALQYFEFLLSCP